MRKEYEFKLWKLSVMAFLGRRDGRYITVEYRPNQEAVVWYWLDRKVEDVETVSDLGTLDRALDKANYHLRVRTTPA